MGRLSHRKIRNELNFFTLKNLTHSRKGYRIKLDLEMN